MQEKVPDMVVDQFRKFSREDLVVFAFWTAWRACVEDSPGLVAELLASDVEEFNAWRSQS